MKNPGIYMLTSPSGKQYVGKDSNLPSRVRDHLSGNAPNCRAIHDAIKKYGADAFDVEIIQYPGISEAALNAVERWWIRTLQTLVPGGYNLTEGGEGVIPSEETRQKFSESARLEQKKRLENGTHHFLGDKNPVHKQLKDGTHNFLDSDFQRRTAKRRLEDGTHNFLDNEIQRRAQIKRDAVNKKRLEDGTHHLLGGEIQRHTAQKRLEDGTHNFIGENHPSKKRVADGTHHFLGKNPNVIVRLAKAKYKIVYQYAVMIPVCFWHALNSVYVHRKLTREGFYDKDIPDTSNAEQVYLL